MFDVIIIGAGPVGLAAAIESKRHGLKYTVLEKGVLANSLFHFPSDMRFFTTAALLEIGNHPFPSTALKPDRMMALDYYRRVTELEQLNIKLHHEVVSLNKINDKFILEVEETFRSKVTKKKFESRFVVIATGYYDNPNGLGGIPGEQGPNTSYYYTEPHQFFNKDVVVIGAGNSGAEASLELYRHGARVTLIHNHANPRSTLKYWVGPDLENRLKNQEIKSVMPAKVTQITNEGVELIKDTETIFVPTDFVFVLTGFHPNVDLFRNWGIAINNDLSISLTQSHEVVDFSGLYVIGSAGHGTAINKVFIENGREHAISAIRDISAK
ncbi:MAG: YpdA family putative bacillithiol disulfide reductase [Candidatus Heimdallarchaeota archaeon]|nr:YpdA family putative bacillithiol disulfide reductase [Candidatus Heimdallarchaeota archaeon]